MADRPRAGPAADQGRAGQGDERRRSTEHFPGVDWDFSQIIRDNVMEALSGVKGENSVKIFGPDLDELEELAEQVKDALATVPGVENAGVFRIKGQSNLEFPVDREKCACWNVSAADVQDVIADGRRRQGVTQMTEGEKLVRHDAPLARSGCGRTSRRSSTSRCDVSNNAVTAGSRSAVAGRRCAATACGLSRDRHDARRCRR